MRISLKKLLRLSRKKTTLLSKSSSFYRLKKIIEENFTLIRTNDPSKYDVIKISTGALISYHHISYLLLLNLTVLFNLFFQVLIVFGVFISYMQTHRTTQIMHRFYIWCFFKYGLRKSQNIWIFFNVCLQLEVYFRWHKN